jgi:CheY-like chemotaxis protein
MNAKKALIVDDSRLAQFVLKKMLANYQLDVDISDSAEDALDYLILHKPDMIFLDHTMPGMNGLEALKQIKGNPKTAAIPVMMYTSQEDSSYMQQAKALGAIDVLPKQINSSQLEQALTQFSQPQAPTEEETETEEIPLSIEQAVNDSNEELEQLVIHAEATFDEANIHQKWQKQLDDQRQEYQQKINELETKISALLPAAETARNRQTFWNNLLWGVIYIATVVTFAIVYIQQKNEIQTLASQLQIEKNRNELLANTDPTPSQSEGTNLTNTAILESDINPDNVTLTELEQTSAPIIRSNQKELDALVNLFNDSNEIPYSDALLGEAALLTINDLVAALQTLEFAGRVNVLAHDGSFCVSAGTSGRFDLAPEDAVMADCQLSETSTRLADIASIDFLQAITAVNQSAENNFIITIEPQGSSSPLEDYPIAEDDFPAEEWNDVALTNRRLEIQLLDN